jgi:hypothetical protein
MSQDKVHVRNLFDETNAKARIGLLKEVENKISFGSGRQWKKPTQVVDDGSFNIYFEQ